MRAESRGRLDRDGRRESILDVAAEVFEKMGYAAASMSAIAARLGGSKGTLYNYFASKDDLFAAHVERQCRRQRDLMNDIVSQDADVRAILQALGVSLLRLVVSGFGLRNFTLVAAEAGRAPQIGRMFYESGPMEGAALVTEFVAAAMADGRLKSGDPAVAAHQFVGMCQNRLFKARLCNYGPEPTEAEIQAEVARAVDTFMAAFAA